MEFHIQCNAQDIARYVILTDDQTRACKTASQFYDSQLVSSTRGYMVYTGTLDGIRMTVASTGMGGPQLAIGIEELAHMGADTFVYIGTCKALRDHVRVGDIVVPTGAFRGGATAHLYLPRDFPAAPHWHVVDTLVETARQLGIHVHLGPCMSVDALYADPDSHTVGKLQTAGVLAIEMEADTLFVVSSLRGWRAGALFACVGASAEIRTEQGREALGTGEAQEMRIAVEALKTVADSDMQAADT